MLGEISTEEIKENLSLFSSFEAMRKVVGEEKMELARAFTRLKEGHEEAIREMIREEALTKDEQSKVYLEMLRWFI